MRKPAFTALTLTAAPGRGSLPGMTHPGGQSKFDTTEIHVDEVRDVAELGEPVAAMIDYLIQNPGSRFGVVKDGFVAAVVMDRADASIFEHLQVRYQDKPGEHQERTLRVSAATVANETGSEENA